MIGIFVSLLFIIAFVGCYKSMEPLSPSTREDKSCDDMFIYFALHDND